MIECHIGQNGDEYQLRCSGHANYAERGRDIVCAAVSALTQSFVIWAQEAEMDGKVTIETLYLDDGVLEIILQGKSCAKPMRMMYLGLLEIKENYFSNFSVKWGEIER